MAFIGYLPAFCDMAAILFIGVGGVTVMRSRKPRVRTLLRNPLANIESNEEVSRGTVFIIMGIIMGVAGTVAQFHH